MAVTRHCFAVILPPSRISRRTDRLRKRLDPRTARVLSSHITVAGPVREERLGAWLSRIRAACASRRPFALKLGRPRRWARVVYLPVSPAGPILELRRRLGGSLRHGKGSWSPHLTLTEHLGPQETRDVHRRLGGRVKPGGFQARALTVVVVPRTAAGYGRARPCATLRFG